MISHVWLIADRLTDEVSYIRHGREGDEPNWRWIGPFAFTGQEAAETAAREPKFLPRGVMGEFRPLEVDTASFIRAIYNGFPPKHTDVFVLDQVLLPLTLNGATWIDEAQEHPVWAPLFDEEGEGVGLDWLDRVLELVASMLHMSMETVQVIGTLNAEEEDAAEVEQTRSLIHQHVRLTLTPEPGTFQVGKSFPGQYRLTQAALFWLHTQGLTKLGLPELEIRNVPARWVTAAGEELLDWAAFSLDHGISEGDALPGGGPVVLELKAVASPDPVWKTDPPGCLRLEVTGVVFKADKAAETIVEASGCKKLFH